MSKLYDDMKKEIEKMRKKALISPPYREPTLVFTRKQYEYIKSHIAGNIRIVITDENKSFIHKVKGYE